MLGNLLVLYLTNRPQLPEYYYEFTTNTQFHNYLTCLMVALIGIRGIYSLRMFQKFRNLIEAVVVCLKEMSYFIILVASYVIMFAVMNFCIQEKSEDQKNYFEAVGTEYQIVFGENPNLDYEAKGVLQAILYFFFTCLINIVMLNLLIQLVSDTYGDVQANEKSTDANAQI